MSKNIDIQQIRDEVIERRIAWNDPTYGQRYLDAIQTLQYFPFKTTILDEHIKELYNIKMWVDVYLREHKDSDVYDIITFVQSWGSTALGFDSFGGDSITDALTTVVLLKDQKGNKSAAVFFAGRFAYYYPASESLLQDLDKRQMISQKLAVEKYTIKDQ